MKAIYRIELALRRDPDRVMLLSKKRNQRPIGVVMTPESFRRLCRAAGAPACDSIWHLTTPREPWCTKCGVSSD